MPPPVEELFLAELAIPEDEGEVQLTLATGWAPAAHPGLRGAVLGELGLTEWLQAELEVPWQVSSAASRAGTPAPMEAGLLAAAIQSAETAMVLSFGYELGAHVLGGGTGLEHELFAAYLFAPRPLSVQLTAGIELEGGEPEPHAHAAGLFDLGAAVLTVEVEAREQAGELSFRVAPGVVASPAADLELGLALPFQPAAAEMGLMLLLSYEAELLDDDDSEVRRAAGPSRR